MKKANKIFSDERGSSAIEYGILSALVAVALILTFIVFGDAFIHILNDVIDNLYQGNQ